MAASPDHSWSALLSGVDRNGSSEITEHESIPLTLKYNTDSSESSEDSQKCDISSESENTPLTHEVVCVHCQAQVTGPVYPVNQYSESSSLMSVSNQSSPGGPVSATNPDSSLQQVSSTQLPAELCLSPLQEPVYVNIKPQLATLGHTQSDTSTMTPVGVCSQAVPLTVRPEDKPRAEPGIETSTQTERDFDLVSGPSPTIPPPPPPPAMRSDSRASLMSMSQQDTCRICHCEDEPGAPLISPCVCCGSLKYVHQTCLQQWIKSADTKSCELCKFNFEMTTRIKPFRKWQKLEMTTVERRKIMCSVTFHIIAITCVIWSLYILIDRTTQEIKAGILEWPFWTKLIVVAIGFTGGLVLMYVQCKMYVQLCRRWRAYNRVIFIQNCPNLTGQKIPIAPHMLDGNGRPKESTATVVIHHVQETELL